MLLTMFQVVLGNSALNSSEKHFSVILYSRIGMGEFLKQKLTQTFQQFKHSK